MSKRAIEFLNILSLQGPNIWTYRPVLEAWVDIGDLEDSPSNTIPGFYERLSAWLPSLIEHRCSYDERGGFLRRVQEGTWPGHILEHVTLELQNLAGMPGGFGKARETPVRGVYKVVVRAWNEEVTRTALYAARDLILAAMDDRPFDVAGTISELRSLVDSLCLGPSTACIVDAAHERRIPHIRLNDGNLVQLGYGSASRRIWTAESDQTSAIAEGIASDKDLTKQLLRACGVPIPEGEVVKSPAEAWAVAQEIGLPVVVKPSNANHGRGVSLELNRQDEVERAFVIADAEGSEVIVESYIRGDEHRLLVVGGKVVAAARGEHLYVTGDGHSPITELVDSQLNSDPRRGDAEEFPLETIRLEREPVMCALLERQDLNPAAIPAAGQQVLIQRNGNVAFDVTDQVHPEVAAIVGLAARVVGLDIAGIDLVAEDISRPLQAQRGAIVEVNAGPGLLMHLKPASGQPRPVGRAIAEHLVPLGETGRIPVIGVSGTHGKTTTARLLARLLQLQGGNVGLACSDGLYFDNRQVEKGNAARWASARKLLMNRNIDMAVIENSAEAILSEGLAYDRCQVGIVTSLACTDNLAPYYIHEVEQVYNVLRTQVDVVLPQGVAVLNADDPEVARMAELCDGDVIFFGLHADNPVLVAHIAAGRRAVFIDENRILLADGENEAVLAVHCIEPAAQTASVLAALAAGWALGLTPEQLRGGLQAFEAESISLADA